MHAHCYRADEILMLIRLAEEMGFKIATFQHVLEGYKVAKEIAAHGAGASTFSDWWAYKIEADDAIPYNAAIMVRKGVLVSINSDSAEHARRLNTEAAKTMKWGGLVGGRSARAGDDQPGEAAAHRQPRRLARSRQGRRRRRLESHIRSASYAIAERVYIDGTLYYDREADEARLTALKKEKSTLAAAEQAARGRPTSDAAGTAAERRRARRADRGPIDDAAAPRSQRVGAGHRHDRLAPAAPQASHAGRVDA